MLILSTIESFNDTATVVFIGPDVMLMISLPRAELALFGMV